MRVLARPGVADEVLAMVRALHVAPKPGTRALAAQLAVTLSMCWPRPCP